MPDIQRSNYASGNPELIQEQKPLTRDERNILKKIRDKKLLFIAGSYGAFLIVLVLAWMENWFDAVDHGDEETLRFKLVAPYTFAFFFIVLTIYFINYYIKDVLPFTKDIKSGFKDQVYFKTEIYKTPFFDGYYIKIPSKKKPMLRINKEMYERIQPGFPGTLIESSHAKFIFSVETMGMILRFNEKNSIIYE